jgi:DNA-binding response OmpR family regulator
MNMKSRRVLVVEPDPAIRALIVAVLRRRGHSPDTAETVEEALELQRSFRPVAVVVEPRIAGGKALIDALAKTDGGTHPAVIVVTTPDSRDTPLCHAPSVRAVLHKPFRIEELAEAVTTCCEMN